MCKVVASVWRIQAIMGGQCVTRCSSRYSPLYNDLCKVIFDNHSG